MKSIIFSSLYLLVLLCLSTFIFDPTHLYYELPWLDIPMHILGGFGVASLACAILNYKGMKVSYTYVFIAYAFVAITWEGYEYVHDMIRGRVWNGWFDTIKDLIDGAIGMSVSYYIQKIKA